MMLQDILKKPGPVSSPLRLLIAAVGEPYCYAEDKHLLKFMVCDQTAIAKAVAFDNKKFPLFKEKSGVVLHNAVVNKDKELVITSQTRVFSSGAPDVPADLLRSAVEVLRPPPPPVVTIMDAKKSPRKTRISICGKITNDSLKTTVTVNAKQVDVRTVTLEDSTGSVKVSLWRNNASQPVSLGDVVSITNVIVNDKRYNNEDSLSSTQYTKIEVTEMPDKRVTGTILGVEVGDTESSIIVDDGIFTASNELLQLKFGCKVEDIPDQLPLEAEFTVKSQQIVSFSENE